MRSIFRSSIRDNFIPVILKFMMNLENETGKDYKTRLIVKSLSIQKPEALSLSMNPIILSIWGAKWAPVCNFAHEQWLSHPIPLMSSLNLKQLLEMDEHSGCFYMLLLLPQLWCHWHQAISIISVIEMPLECILFIHVAFRLNSRGTFSSTTWNFVLNIAQSKYFDVSI